MTEKKEKYDVGKARAVLVEERKKRTAACWTEIEKVLEKHECNLVGEPQFVPSPSGYSVRVNIWVSARDD